MTTTAASMRRYAKTDYSLRDEPFFRDMSDGVRAQVEDFVYHREYEPRQIVYFPDDACDYTFWVRHGRVKITRVSATGRELTFRHLFAGDMFGEECLSETGRRGAYAEALEPTVLCLMRADDFRRLAREENEMCFCLAESLCRRAVETEQVLAETVFSSVRSRVAAGLMRLTRRANLDEGAPLKITHQDIANLVGATRETTTAVLHELRNSGIVAMANRRITVLEPVALERVAGSRG